MSIFAPGVAIKKRPIEDGQPYAALTRAWTKTSEPDSARDRVAVWSVPTNWLRPSGGRPLRPLYRVLWQPSAAHTTPHMGSFQSAPLSGNAVGGFDEGP